MYKAVQQQAMDDSIVPMTNRCCGIRSFVTLGRRYVSVCDTVTDTPVYSCRWRQTSGHAHHADCLLAYYIQSTLPFKNTRC